MRITIVSSVFWTGISDESPMGFFPWIWGKLFCRTKSFFRSKSKLLIAAG